MQKSELELIIETIPDAVMVIDHNGNIDYVNSAAERIFRLSRGEIQSRTYNASSWKITTLNGKPFPEKDLPFNQAIEYRKPVYGVVYAVERLDSTKIILSVNAAPLLDENDNVDAVVASLTDITEQYQSAKEIRESRRQVLDILESIADGFFALDNDWRFTYVNHKAEELLGTQRENLLFRNMWQVLSKEEASRVFEQFHSAKERRISVLFEDFVPRFGRWLEIHVYFYEHGLSVYFRDITDRKKTEQALRDSEELNRLTLSNITDAVYLTDDAGSIIYVCPNVDIIFGYSDQEVQAIGNIEHLLGKDLLVPIGLETSLPQSLTNIEREITDKFGRIHTLLINVIRVSIKGGTRLYVCRDITERKKVEDGLLKSEQRYRELFEECFDGIYIASLEGKILDTNKKMAEIFGYRKKDEMLGLNMARDLYVNQEDRKRALETISKKSFAEFDIPMKKKNGEKFIARISLAAMRDRDGNIISHRGMVRDISEKKSKRI